MFVIGPGDLMCDELKLFGMLSRIDERTAIMQEDQKDIFSRLGKLERKSPICSYHDGLMLDVAGLKTDAKIADVRIILITSVITTVAVAFLIWAANNIHL